MKVRMGRGREEREGKGRRERRRKKKGKRGEKEGGGERKKEGGATLSAYSPFRAVCNAAKNNDTLVIPPEMQSE